MKNLARILRSTFPYWPKLVGLFSFNVLSTIFSLFSIGLIVPFLKILFYGNVETNSNPGDLSGKLNAFFNDLIIHSGKEKALIIFCALLILFILLKNVARYISLLYMSFLRMSVVKDYRDKLQKKILELPLSFFTKEKKGDLVTRATSDIAEIEWALLGSLEMLFRDPIIILVYFSLLIFISWKLTLFILLALPITGFFISRIGKKLKTTSQNAQKQLGQVISIFEESISGGRVLRAFKAESFTNRKFKLSNGKYAKHLLSMYRKQYLASPLSEVVVSLVLVGLMYLGAKMIFDGSSSLNGEFFIWYLLSFSQIIAPAKSLSEVYFRVQKGSAALDRVDEILNDTRKVEEVEKPISLAKFEQEIRFENVFFSYGDEMVLQDISFSVKKGQKVALVGASGSGKSTLVDLLPRFHDPIKGKIFVDSIEISQSKLSDLRELFGVVTQQSVLFNDTVLNNISLAKTGATKEEIIEAAKVANAHNFILELNGQYEYNIGEGGGQLSGGQRQRITIARAILKNPQILILDEATSALDTESERLVQDAIDNLVKDRTAIVIAHRLSTVQNSDLIIVLEKGKIMEKGTHKELFEQKGIYRKMCELQKFD